MCDHPLDAVDPHQEKCLMCGRTFRDRGPVNEKRPPFNNGATTVAMAHQDRSQRERIAALEAALDSLIEASSRFTAEASYSVEVGTEEDFVAALDDARLLFAMAGETDA